MVDSSDFVAADTPCDVVAAVVTYNSADHLRGLLDDLRREAKLRRVRVIVVDNASVDDSIAIVSAVHGVVVVESGGNLGYSGGLNRARDLFGGSEAVLILNPDLRLREGAVDVMRSALDRPGVGAVVPRMVGEDAQTYPSLRYEPSILRSLGDVVFGRSWRTRPSCLTENVRPATQYMQAHAVDWATGAAIMLRTDVESQVGNWDERYFLYSEETDYLRRVRDHGYSVWYEPAAVVEHVGGGSGTSPTLSALMAVNKVRYIEAHRGPAYVGAYRATVALAELRRSRDPVHRSNLAFVLDRERWIDLPRATMTPTPLPHGSGAVVVPAHNESTVIAATLTPLSAAAADGAIELIVACNGCTDDTAEVARSVPGVRVIEIEEASKIAALNAGDDAANLWPRLYLDADIQISPEAVAAVFDALRTGDILAARPGFRYVTTGATAPVRSYYRARQRIAHFKDALWGAGAYALSEEGHRRIGRFPNLTADDLWIDEQFNSIEKQVVPTQPTLVSTPRDSRTLVNTLRRVYRGSNQVPGESSSGRSITSLLKGVRGPRTAVDALVYASFALAGRRMSRRQPDQWERDDSSRVQR